ncbi:SAM-dependent methyltransferase [Pseudoalteromonas obscura]|uniref:Cyclopropane-fatty-acyl-phospholipid synthase family protein n=1 Tax=Pseudoalteromonas obscura TaxID=3048491 RepID=A0ABT7EQS2_9GAMM|nr:cyclopropane-fatty-acyl-phospholipid synthase family protein [Pseudoalteromonas sp. P94(2023)]MDK2597397.1 cyclopropane-fatty-acyl-phospholipid synthase family protein [Pseudoalteromonas sp. P94(2023)]
MEKTTQSFSSENSDGFLVKVCKTLVIKALAQITWGHIRLIDADQEFSFGNEKSADKTTIHVQSGQMYAKFALGGSVGAGESYILGHWTCSDLTKLIEIFVVNQDVLDQFEKKFALISGLFNKVTHFKNRNTKAGSKKNIVAHYDLGNDLYSAFLSEEMLYSSAVYPTHNATLEAAQQHKLKQICEQVDLNKSDHVIEIGTGWGAFAIYAAQNYGCKVTTTTISEEQYAYVSQRINELGLQEQITLLKDDYRELGGKFDKLVSIEMIEAVGHDYLAGFFEKCSALLKPDGVMLIQAITIACQRYHHYLKNSDFIQQYIFPGGCLPSITEMSKQICNSTDLVVHSVKDIGLHYAKTLYDWRERFDKAWPSLDNKKFDQQFYRLWEFYLCYCEGGFKQRATSAVHLVARKPRHFSDDEKAFCHY